MCDRSVFDFATFLALCSTAATPKAFVSLSSAFGQRHRGDARETMKSTGKAWEFKQHILQADNHAHGECRGRVCWGLRFA
eukprot:1779449-Amphidinium_carterae.1